MTQQPVTFPLGGGMDLVTPMEKKAPGSVIAALNYEPVSNGYMRFSGYERFDGRPAPSDATYWRVDYTAGGFSTGVAPSVGDRLYNGAPDNFLVVKVITVTGTWAGGDAAGYFIATDYNGTITPAQDLFTAPSAGQFVATAGTITLEYDFSALDLISSGDMSSGAAWSATNWTVAGGVATASGTGGLRQTAPLISGIILGTYRVTYTIVSITTGSVRPFVSMTLSGTPVNLGHARTSAGTYTEDIVATSAAVGLIGLYSYASDAVVDNVSFIKLSINDDCLELAREVTRDQIETVGDTAASGPVRGIWVFDDEILAVRDNAAATSGVIYKATTSGWAAVVLLTRIPFTCDTATQTLPSSKAPSNTLANASSSTSDGTIRRVVIESTVGTLNTGFLLVSGYVAGSFTAGGQTIYLAGTATIIGTTTAAAAATAALPAGGRYFFITHNFYGSDDLEAVYMVNGVGAAHSYDGFGLGAISTGMTTDTPTRLAAHRGSLFLAFPGGALEASVVGEPMSFSGVLGSVDIGIGSEVSDLIAANKSSLAVLSESAIGVIYGNDHSDYQLEVLTDEAGALPYTAQRLGPVLYMDNVGVRTLSASAAFGNFSLAAISAMIEPLIRDYRRDGVLPVASLVWRRKNQYWLFFDNDTALVFYMGNKRPEIMPVDLGFTVTCAVSVEDADGIERVLVGTSDGYVMELGKGTSFDGDAIEHYFRLPFTSFGSPQIEKRAHKVTLNMRASGTTTFSVAVDFDYGSVQGFEAQSVSVTTGGGALDDLGSNEDYFASQIETVAEVYIDGVALNFALKVSGETDDEESHTATSVTYHISPRGLKR